MKTIQLLLFVCLIFIIGCKKQQQNTPSPKSYTSKMGGIRIWHGTVNTSYSGLSNIADTFTISIINDSTIIVKGKTLKYNRFDTLYKAIVYNVKYDPGYSGQFYTNLAYYFATDNIFYEDDISGSGGYSYLKLYTP